MLNVRCVHLVFAIIGIIICIAAVACQDLPIIYNAKASTGGIVTSTVCPATHDLRENITQDIRLLVKNSILPSLTDTRKGYGACGCTCGGPGWRRAA